MGIYLDADVFLALIKEPDRFKAAAIRFLSDNKETELSTSTLTCLEVWFYLYKNNLKSKALDSFRAICSLCEIIDYKFFDMENAILLANHHNLSPADALHAVLAMNFDAIVSSDSSFDKVPGLKRLDFTKQ